jgi:hypothetical protein
LVRCDYEMDKYKMSLFSFLLAIVCFILIISLIFFVIFGQVTVRKLRKNPETKDALGTEFVSGWDIVNTAMALTLPIKLCRKTKLSPFGMLHADPDVLYKHTTRLDRILARAYFIPTSIATFSAVILMILDMFGFF